MEDSPYRFCNPKYLMLVVMLVEAVKVAISLSINSYEERDFASYFEQSQIILGGQMDYTQVSSRNGALVYPAVSTYINMLLYRFVGDEGTYYRPTQVINGLAYLVWVFWMVRIAQLAFKDNIEKANIVILHCFTFTTLNIMIEANFNDAYWVMFSMLAVWQFQRSRIAMGIALLSLGISCKMSAALYLPAAYLIASKTHGLFKGTILLMIVFWLQIVFAYPYLAEYSREYLTSAYNFDRSFRPQDSFNWNFMSENIMESKIFKNLLLIFHLFFLMYFLLSKWLKMRTMMKDLGVYPIRIFSKLTRSSPYHVAEVFFVWNFIGIIFSRGLYYQYVSWFSMTIPFLLEIGIMQFWELKMKDLVFFVVTLDTIYTLRAFTNFLSPVVGQILIITIFGFIIAAAFKTRLRDDWPNKLPLTDKSGDCSQS